jgi:hypothetical protein
MKQTIQQHKKWNDDPSKGEVSTPSELVCEMLDKIPNYVWENPKSTFLDPCMGNGTFIVEIVKRLVNIYRYSKEDAISRVYGYDTCVKYIHILRRGGLINLFHKDFLNEELNMKFDVVVGNPPYQETHEDGRSKKNALRLWAKFVIHILDKNIVNENGYLSFVTPSGWAGSSSEVYQKMKNYNLISADFSSFVSQSFNNVGGTMIFTSFLLQNSPKSGVPKIKFNQGNSNVDIFNMGITPIKSTNMYDFTIIQKMLNSGIVGLPWQRFDDKNKEINGLSIVMTRSKSESNNSDFTHNLDDRSGFWLYGEQEYLETVLNNINLPIYKHFRWVVRSGMAIANNIKLLPIPTNIKLTNDNFCELFGLNKEEMDYVKSITI